MSWLPPPFWELLVHVLVQSVERGPGGLLLLGESELLVCLRSYSLSAFGTAGTFPSPESVLGRQPHC